MLRSSSRLESEKDKFVFVCLALEVNLRLKQGGRRSDFRHLVQDERPELRSGECHTSVENQSRSHETHRLYGVTSLCSQLVGMERVKDQITLFYHNLHDQTMIC